jgi:hypothetical protein
VLGNVEILRQKLLPSSQRLHAVGVVTSSHVKLAL